MCSSDLAAAQFFCANRQGAQRAIHRIIRKSTRRRQAFAKLHDSAEGVDNGEVLAGRTRDEQAAIVRTKIEGSVGLAASRRALCVGRGFRGARRLGLALVCVLVAMRGRATFAVSRSALRATAFPR